MIISRWLTRRFPLPTALILMAAGCNDSTAPSVETLDSLDVSFPAEVTAGAPFDAAVTAVGSQGTRPFTGFNTSGNLEEGRYRVETSCSGHVCSNDGESDSAEISTIFSIYGVN